MHWAIAAAVVGLMVLGWWMQAIPKQPVGPRADAYNLHKSIGLAALLLMAVRLAWRASHRPPALPPLPRWQAHAAAAVHLLLYAVMFIAALSGYIGSATSGYPVKFFGWVLPSWAGCPRCGQGRLQRRSSGQQLGAGRRHRCACRRNDISSVGLARRPAVADVAARPAGAQARRRSARRALKSPVEGVLFEWTCSKRRS